MNTYIIQPAGNLHLFSKVKVKNILTLLLTWQRNRATRIELSKMPDYILDDIGLTNQQATNEVKKYFWQN